MQKFIKNEKYVALLIENQDYHKRVRAGQATYLSNEWKNLQAELLEIELNMSGQDIIYHAESTFPDVRIK